jgi:hypothetical protein
MAALLILASVRYLPAHSTRSFVNSSTVSISLPADILSETIQIHYFMAGPFGGYGGFIAPKPNQTDYEIDASTQGKLADSMKILVYAPGCKIQTFDLNLTRVPNRTERFACESLPQIRIDGAIPRDLMHHENAELSVHYMAFWASSFFGVKDGPVIDFEVATATPDLDGNFRVEIPDFSADGKEPSHPGGASLHFTLRDCKTLNPIALNLSPEQQEYESETHELKILSSYPNGLKFVNLQELPDSKRQYHGAPTQPAEQERIPCIFWLTAPASQLSDSWACGALGRSPSQGRDAKPNFWRMRATLSDTFLRYSSGA